MIDQQFDLDEVRDELRLAILEDLRQQLGRKQQRQAETVKVWIEEIRNLLRDRVIQPRDEKRLRELACEVYHELYLERIIVPGDAGSRSQDAMKWPSYRITDHGRKVLETKEYSPYDPSGYLARLKLDILDVDDTIVRYVEESLKCLQMECLLAAAVTIGCASEKAMLLIIERFGDAISDAGKKQEYEKAQREAWAIRRKYQVFRNSLDGIAESLPKELRIPLESHLDGAFNLIRHVRNDAGHPSGEPITRDMIVANQTIFPGYCKYVYSLMDHLTNHSVGL